MGHLTAPETPASATVLVGARVLEVELKPARKSTDPWFRARFRELSANDAARVLYLDASWARQTMHVLYAGAWDGLPPWQTVMQGTFGNGGEPTREWYESVTPKVRAVQVLWHGGPGLSVPRSVFLRNWHLWWWGISDEVLLVDIDAQDWVVSIEHEGEFRSMTRASLMR